MKKRIEHNATLLQDTKEDRQLSRVSGDDSSSQHSDNDQHIFRMEDTNMISPRHTSNRQHFRLSDRMSNEAVTAPATSDTYKLPRSHKVESFDVIFPRDAPNRQNPGSNNRNPKDAMIAPAIKETYKLTRSHKFESYRELQDSLSPPRDPNTFFGQRTAQANVENQPSTIGQFKKCTFGSQSL